MRKVDVKLTEGAEESIEILASSITAIADGFDRLSKTPIKRDTLVLLIYNAIPGQTVPKKHINAVLDYIPQLKKIYLK